MAFIITLVSKHLTLSHSPSAIWSTSCHIPLFQSHLLYFIIVADYNRSSFFKVQKALAIIRTDNGDVSEGNWSFPHILHGFYNCKR